MKKLMIILFAVTAITVTTIKKETGVAASKNGRIVKISEEGNTSLDKGNVSTWD